MNYFTVNKQDDEDQILVGLLFSIHVQVAMETPQLALV
jgi:hypothetical protein